MSMSKREAKKILDKALSEATLGDVRVRLRARQTGNARFGDSMPTTSGDVEELDVEVTATTPDGRHASAKGNRTDDAGLGELVRQAESMAKLSPVDPEHPRPIGKTKYANVAAIDRSVLKMGSTQRSEAVRAAIDAGKAEGTAVSGFLRHRDSAVAHADRAGLFAYHRGTHLSLGCTCRTPDGTGSSKRGWVSHAAKGLDPKSVAGDAAKWAVQSKSPTRLDPGLYTVILTPDAVADLLDFFVGALGHRPAAEGRSYFSAPDGKTRLGETMFSPDIDLWSDPADKVHPASPIARDGRPHGRVEWVKGGKLLALSASRSWAEKAGVPSRPTPNTLHMKGGSADLDKLIEGVDRGVLVTRFWYNRMVQRRTILATGLTRDGTFLVEKGKIARSTKAFRYNESPVTILKKVVAMGAPERAGLSRRRVYVVPPMVVEGFNFESVSDAV